MPTSNFFTSRANFVGITLALVVLVAHLVLGLGALWPLAAVAAWGAGVALTPTPRQPSLEAPKESDPFRLAMRLHAALTPFSTSGVQPVEAQALRSGEALDWVLQHWDELAEAPEQKIQYATIIEEYLPGLGSAYQQVYSPRDDRAVSQVVESLSIIETEAEKTKAAIIDQNVMELDNHARVLKLQFGRFEGLDPGPTPGTR